MIPEALDGIPVELRLLFAARRARLAHGVVAARLAAGRALARRVRRAPLHRLDVPAAARRPARDDDPRPRAAALPGVGRPPARARCTARKYANAARTCDVMFANSALHRRRHRATLGFPRERIVVAHPGVGAESPRRRRAAADLGVPYLLTVATLEPRKNLGTLVDAFALLARRSSRSRSSAAPAGAQQPELDRPGVVRLGRVSDERARAALPRRGGGRLPVAVRGLRDADHRGDGVGRAGRRLGAPVDGRGVRRRGRAGRPRRAPRRSRPRSATRSAGATSCVAQGLAHAAGFSWARTGELFLEGYRPILVGLDTTSLRSDARRHGAPRATGCSTHLDVPVRELGASRRRRGCAPSRPDALVVPAPAAPTAARRAPLPDLPRRRSRRRCRSSSPSTTSPCCASPSGSTAGRAPTRRFAVPRVVRAATRGDRRLRVHEARARRAARRARGARSASCRTRSRTSFTPDGPAAEGDYVLAVGTLEPRKNLAPRSRRGGRRRAARRRRARLGRRRAAGARRPARRGRRRGARARSTAARAASSTPRCTRASGSRSPRRSPAAARS